MNRMKISLKLHIGWKFNCCVCTCTCICHAVYEIIWFIYYWGCIWWKCVCVCLSLSLSFFLSFSFSKPFVFDVLKEWTFIKDLIKIHLLKILLCKRPLLSQSLLHFIFLVLFFHWSSSLSLSSHKCLHSIYLIACSSSTSPWALLSTGISIPFPNTVFLHPIKIQLKDPTSSSFF